MTGSTVVRGLSGVLTLCYLADVATSVVAVSRLRMLAGERSRIAQRALERMPCRARLPDHAAERELLGCLRLHIGLARPTSAPQSPRFSPPPARGGPE